MSGPEFHIEALVTVKAYPQPSKTYGETVCVAGARLDTEEPEWCRLYPVDLRGLPRQAQFRKYDVIRCTVRRPRSDTRPESLCPIRGTIRRVGSVGGWLERARYLEPLRVASMCELKALQRLQGTSLGLFRPGEVTDFHVEAADPWDEGRLCALNQGSLFGERPQRPLEQIPYKFSLSYICDDANCSGHRMLLIDWEAGELFRKTAGRPEEARLRLVRERWLDLVCGPRRDPQFFAGSIHKHPTSFVLLGVFWPPKLIAAEPAVLTLF